MSKKGISHRRFSDEFKLRVVEEYLTGSVSAFSLCKKHSIGSSLLCGWIHSFAPEYKLEPAIMSSKKSSDSATVAELKKVLRQKELELKREKMRADFYETMVDVAEEQFNIAIRKKTGAKL